MENNRPYWQVALRLLFSLLATAAFVIAGWNLLRFLMAFCIWLFIGAFGGPVVNWLV